MKTMSTFTTLASVAVALMLATGVTAEVVTYRLTVDNTWSLETHPDRFPLNDAHFSWLGGGTHNDQVSFWQPGEVASPGVVQMAETGVIDDLVGEVGAQVVGGNAFRAMAYRWWFCPETTTANSCGDLSVEFEVDSEFPLVTLMTMLGPSPDWFVGVNGLSLRAGNRWQSEVVVDLRPYDGGTRSANIWKLGGPTSSPVEAIALIDENQLVGPESLGTFTFTLLTPQPTAISQSTWAEAKKVGR